MNLILILNQRLDVTVNLVYDGFILSKLPDNVNKHVGIDMAIEKSVLPVYLPTN